MASDPMRWRLWRSTTSKMVILPGLRRFLSQSLDTARRARSRQLDLECQYHGHLGFVYAQLGLYTDARATLEAGLELANRLGIGRYRAYQMLNLGLVHWRMGDLNSAIQMEEAALAEYSATGEAFGQAACHAYLGSVYEARGDLTAASQYLAEARTMFAALGVEPDTVRSAGCGSARVVSPGTSLKRRSRLTAEVWRYLRAKGTEGLGSPCWVHICVADVLGCRRDSRHGRERGDRNRLSRADAASDKNQ